jgi:hypothetical protein
MFVLPVKSAELFILFPPGARGDFLASVLNDTIQDCYSNYIIPTPENYQKAHWVKNFVNKNIHGFDDFKIKIRIRLSDTEEYLTVAHLWREKLGTFPSDNNPYIDTIKNLTSNEMFSKSVDHMFDYVVDFKNLYNVDYVEQLYKTIRNRDLAPGVKEKIKSNISLQPWVSLNVSYRL